MIYSLKAQWQIRWRMYKENEIATYALSESHLTTFTNRLINENFENQA